MIGAVIQARTGSSRLPNKILRPLCGKTVLEQFLLRVQRIRNIQAIVVATTDQTRDDPVVDIARNMGLAWFRGSEQDVLDRFVQAARAYDIDVIVRVTPDDPLMDPEVTDRVIALFEREDPPLDLACNNVVPSFPYGIDAEVIRRAALERAWRETDDPFNREHVSPYIRRRPDIFRVGGIQSPKDYSHYRLTLDYEQDYQVVAAIYAALYREGEVFLMDEIVSYLERHPHIVGLNQGMTVRAR